jgi:hypothetical protein
MFGRARSLFLLLTACEGLLACQAKPRDERPTAPPATTPSLPAVASARAGQPRKQVSELLAPPPVPPEEAKDGPAGSRIQVFKEGTGAPVPLDQGVRAEVTIWTRAGNLVFSTYSSTKEMSLPLSFVPAPVRSSFAAVRPGGKARFWLPEELVKAHVATTGGQLALPPVALIVDYEPLAALALAQTEVPASATPTNAESGVVEPRFPRPDAGGPTAGALRTPGGLSYVKLTSAGGGTPLAPKQRARLHVTAWPVTGLVVGAPILDESSVTTLERAPAGLSDVLKKLSVGEAARIWLPADRAVKVVPTAQGREVVLDLLVERVE